MKFQHIRSKHEKNNMPTVPIVYTDYQCCRQ